MSSLTALPNELIQEIAACAESGDLLALCRTSRQIYANCIATIYRSITLETTAKLVKCCKTIISRAQVAEFICEMYMYAFLIFLWYILSHRSAYSLCLPFGALKAFYTTVQRAVRRLKNVRILQIPRSRIILHLLSDMHFPKLCGLAVVASPEIFSLLKRNLSITHLQLCPPSSEHADRYPTMEAGIEFPEPPVHLPSLRCFVGPSIFVWAFTPGRLSHITIFWERFQTSVLPCTSRTISRLKPGIVQFKNIMYEWKPSLVSLIACHIPGLEQLVLRKRSAYRDINVSYGNLLVFSICSHTPGKGKSSRFSTFC